jgi:hypothetical protein
MSHTRRAEIYSNGAAVCNTFGALLPLVASRTLHDQGACTKGGNVFDVNDFLDRAKRAAGVSSDYALAVKVLGYKEQTSVSNWRKGRSLPDERAAMKLCELTGDDPEHVVACFQSMRAANDDAAELWRRIADRLRSGGAASIAFLSVTAILFLASLTEPVQAAPALLSDLHQGLCIMSTVALLRLAYRLLTHRNGASRVGNRLLLPSPAHR